MNATFDIAAKTYDAEFTYSNVGSLQRKVVWKYLDEILDSKQNLKILELNCGTGEDALIFSQKGHHVTATDISEKMLEKAYAKGSGQSITFQNLDLNCIDEYNFEHNFDLIFSNFGGLNCIDPKALHKVGEYISKFLNDDGKFVAVVMPKFCVWETCYFLAKVRLGKAFRRQQRYAIANVSGTSVKTWYYSPTSFDKLMQTRLKKEVLKPVGLFLPPSYLESFFRRYPKLLKMLDWLEKKIARSTWQASISDHFFIQYRLI